MVKSKLIWVSGIVLVIFCCLSGEMIAWQWFHPSGSPKTAWYDVTDDEVEKCSKGIDVPGVITDGGSHGDSNYIYELTFSLQASETELHNVSLFEVSYYIEPLEGNLTFEVFLLGSGISTNVTGELVSKPNGGKVGYEFIEDEKGIYTEALIDYWGDSSGSYIVPVVKNEEE